MFQLFYIVVRSVLPTTMMLEGKVIQLVMSVCLFPLCLLNALTFDL